ncbi:MAG: hypothetical protein ABSB15_27175 [Bryobacteraceae bacterium]|jgi:hypothetical protein
MRTGRHGSLIALLTASSALFAQSDVPDVRQIVASSVAATQRHWREWVLYSYLERDENRRLDPAGKVKSEEVDVSRAILVNGVQFEQLMERNGRPLSADEERKQNAELDKLKRLTPEQSAERLRKDEEENTSLVGEVPRAFDFQLAGEEVVNGRPAWVLQAAPHPGYRSQGTYGKMFSKVAGKLWVDKRDFGWIKVDGYVIQPFSMGLFFARVLRGSHITMEQTHVAEGLWMPGHIEVRAAAKILFIKSLVIDRVLTYSEYEPPQSAAPATGNPAIPSAGHPD